MRPCDWETRTNTGERRYSRVGVVPNSSLLNRKCANGDEISIVQAALRSGADLAVEATLIYDSKIFWLLASFHHIYPVFGSNWTEELEVNRENQSSYSLPS